MKFFLTIRIFLMIRVSPFTKKSYLTSYYRVYTGHPSIETSVSAASPFPSPPADNPLPALTTPSPEGSTSMNPPNRHLSPRAATTTATMGLTRSSCHFLPPSLPLFKYVLAMCLIIFTCSIQTTRITSISKPLGSNYNELYISYRVYRQS